MIYVNVYVIIDIQKGMYLFEDQIGDTFQKGKFLRVPSVFKSSKILQIHLYNLYNEEKILPNMSLKFFKFYTFL